MLSLFVFSSFILSGKCWSFLTEAWSYSVDVLPRYESTLRVCVTVLFFFERKLTHWRVPPSVCQCVRLIKRLLTFLDTCPDTWPDWDKLIPAITTPAAVSSGEQQLTRIRRRRQRGCKERAEKEARWSCTVGLWIIYKNCENDRKKAGMGRSCSVTLHVSKSFFFSFYFFHSSCLLTSAVRQPVAQSDTLCS